jgi:hypothetical protein
MVWHCSIQRAQARTFGGDNASNQIASSAVVPLGQGSDRHNADQSAALSGHHGFAIVL